MTQNRALRFSKSILEIFSRLASPGRVLRISQPMLIADAGVSTLHQNLELQLEALEKAGCKRFSRTNQRLASVLGREGDTLAVWKLDRLGRSVKHLVDLEAQLPHPPTTICTRGRPVQETHPFQRHGHPVRRFFLTRRPASSCLVCPNANGNCMPKLFEQPGRKHQ